MIWTVLFIVLVLVCGYYAFKDDDHDEWKGY
jgi:hypothetical protein